MQSRIFHENGDKKFILIQGDSGTWKSPLYDLVALSYHRLWSRLTCSAECIPAICLGGENWTHPLQAIHGSILFFEQNDVYIANKTFAEIAMAADNYYVFLTWNR